MVGLEKLYGIVLKHGKKRNINMAIVAGQKALLGEAKDYLLNPTIVGAGAGVGYAAIMHGKGRDTSYQESATTGAQWGFGLGAAGLGIAALSRFRQTKFTIPPISKTDWNKYKRK